MARVLYVEDNFDNYKLVEFILTKNGFSVMNAVDGLDAIEKAESYKPDLIIMDLNLPNLKGFEAATLIKSKPETKDIPIVVLTAAYSNEYRYLADKIGCVGYFTKPIDPLTFPDDIKKILDGKEEKNLEDPLVIELSKSLEEKAKKVVQFGRELSKIERRFNSIVESIMDPIMLLDVNNIVVYLNSAANNYDFLKGLYKKSIDFSMFFDDSEKYINQLGKIGYIKNHIFKLENFTFIGNFIKLDKETLITLKDITEITNVAEKQRELDKVATIGRIASGVLHELNNPMSAMKAYLDLYPQKILKAEDREAILNEFVSKLKKSFDKMMDLVANLTFFVRKSSETEININLNNLIKEVLTFSGYDIRRGGVNVELALSENISLIRGYKSEIEQAILNLLLNASDALNGRENPKIIIRSFEDEGFVNVEIEDNAGGIPEDVQKNMFEPFFTTKNDEKSTGLGLTIVLNVVNKHMGLLKYFTSENGTKFVLSFPKLTETVTDGKD